MDTLREIFIIGLLAALIGVAVVASQTLRAINHSVERTSTEVQRAARTVADFAEFQISQLQSPRNQKAIEAGLALAASAQGTVRLVNTQTLPRLHQAIDTLNDSAARLGVLTSNTDREINQAVLPAVARTLNSLEADARAFGTTAEILNKTIVELAASGRIGFDAITSIMGSEEWAAIRSDLKTATGEVAATAHQVRLSSEQMPAIAASLEKISSTSAKYEKALLLARLFSLVFGALRPW